MNWKDKLKELKNNTDAWYYQDLEMFITAYNNAVNEFNTNQNAVNVKNVANTEKLLKEKILEIWSELYPAERVFSNQQEVVEYLTSEGFKISRSKLSNDKKAGMIRPDENGLYSLKTVMKYAESLPKLDGSFGDDDSLAEQKALLELREKELKIKEMEHNAAIKAGQYIKLETYEQDLATRAMLFKSDMENFLIRTMPELVVIVSGDEQFIPEAISFMLSGLKEVLNNYAERKMVTVDASG